MVVSVFSDAAPSFPSPETLNRCSAAKRPMIAGECRLRRPHQVVNEEKLRPHSLLLLFAQTLTFFESPLQMAPRKQPARRNSEPQLWKQLQQQAVYLATLSPAIIGGTKV
ncbi:hypothetical protein E2562_001877 [Oryza meyeriana var. granulata]|uniref:Uncharacterized protein n=1 Tax=Oryza meyeriana var. granulata TaxID=110450 RepID=A0A6G1C3N4_9ORYZ|nr:hypothetical protein E2562_001877 [Oryza meyeriana var. granulata]